MCEPTLMTGLAIGSSAVSQVGQVVQANRTASALDTQRRAQAQEISAQAEGQLGERVKQARRERARLRVAAGEAGVGGGSVSAQLRDSFAQQNQDAATIARNARFADRASEARTESAFAQIDRPNLLTAGLQIATAGYSGYSQGLQLENLKRLSIEGG